MSDESAELLLADPLFEVGLDAAAFGVAVFPEAIADDTALAADDPIGAIEFICDQSISLSPHLNYFFEVNPVCLRSDTQPASTAWICSRRQRCIFANSVQPLVTRNIVCYFRVRSKRTLPLLSSFVTSLWRLSAATTLCSGWVALRLRSCARSRMNDNRIHRNLLGLEIRRQRRQLPMQHLLARRRRRRH
jgi:hypothetical protein